MRLPVFALALPLLATACATGPSREELHQLASACDAGRTSACIALQGIQADQLNRQMQMRQNMSNVGLMMLMR